MSTSAETESASQWLTLAKLTGSLGAGLGAGLKADAEVSLDKGKLILSLNASVIFSPGAGGKRKQTCEGLFLIEIDQVVPLTDLNRL